MLKRPSETQITDLAAGKLSPVAAWLLRRRIARDADLSRELRETEAVFSELQTLRAETPARSTFPVPSASDRQPTGNPWRTDAPVRLATPTITLFGGLVMNRRAVFTATAALCLLCVTGGYAAVRLLYPSLSGLDTGTGHVWDASFAYQGEVKFYSPDKTDRGSIGHSNSNPNAAVEATVTIDKTDYPVSGAGKHELRGKDGNLIGIVELIPETTAQREALTAKHDRENHIDEKLAMQPGAVDGYGNCIGGFGSAGIAIANHIVVANKYTHWQVQGANLVINFYDAKTHKQVYQAHACDVNDQIRAEMKRTLSPESYAARVSSSVPPSPIFTWTANDTGKDTDKTERHVGYGSFPMTLADGTVLRVEVARDER